MRKYVIAASILAITLAALAVAQRAVAQTKHQPASRTIFIPAMDGFEKNIANALSTEEVPVQVVMEQANSDLQVKASGGTTSVPPIEVVLYRKETGHDPFSFLDVVEVKTNRHLLTYRFVLTNDEAARTKDAQEFATELRKKLVSK